MNCDYHIMCTCSRWFASDPALLKPDQIIMPLRDAKVRMLELKGNSVVHCVIGGCVCRLMLGVKSSCLPNCKWCITQVVVVCISNDFVTDTQCCELFHFIKNMQKMVQLVVLGDGQKWLKSDLGLQLASEVQVQCTTLLLWFISSITRV